MLSELAQETPGSLQPALLSIAVLVLEMDFSWRESEARPIAIRATTLFCGKIEQSANPCVFPALELGENGGHASD